MKKFNTIVILLAGLSASAQINDEVKPFAPGIISNNKVFGLSLSPDGRTAYYVNSYGGRQKLQIMQSDKLNGNWQKPKPAFFSDPNFREIDPFVSADGNTILYNSRKSVGKNGDDTKDLDIWMVRRDRGKWWKPFPVKEVNTIDNETYATIASSGNIYFGARREHGGYGGNDIYVSRRINGQYQKPENLGYPINSKNDEGNSFIAPDESYMIYSSDGDMGGFGQSDLYITFNNNGKWSHPINLGGDINSAQNDFCPVMQGNDTLIFARSQKIGESLVENIYYTRINIPFLKALSSVRATSILNTLFPDGDVYGITFSPDGKHAYTTKSTADRSICEVFMMDISPNGEFANPRRMDVWQITPNVSNPVISHDGTFALLRISSPGLDPDLYISRKDAAGIWQRPMRLSAEINTSVDQYYPEVTANNDLYFSSNGDVFYAAYKDGTWQAPMPVKELNTINISESNITVSRNGQWLVFLSNRKGMYGGYDLYLCKKEGYGWSAPVNLGSALNTNAMEYQPRFSLDDRFLYLTRSVFVDGKRQGKDDVLRVNMLDILTNFSLFKHKGFQN